MILPRLGKKSHFALIAVGLFVVILSAILIGERLIDAKREAVLSEILKVNQDDIYRLEFHNYRDSKDRIITDRSAIKTFADALRSTEQRGNYHSYSSQSWNVRVILRDSRTISLDFIIDQNTPGFVTLYDLRYNGRYKNSALLDWVKTVLGYRGD